MKNKNRNSLLGKTLVVFGFTFSKHPTKPDHFCQISIYQDQKDFVICTSEGRGKGDVELAKGGLGKSVPGELIFMYAQRFLSGLPADELKRIMIEGYPNDKWYWRNNV